MVEKKKDDLLPIIMIAGLGVGGYFLYKYLKKDGMKEGFIRVSSPIPSEVKEGEIVSVTVMGKNTTRNSHLCFIQIVDQETGNLLTPQQSTQVEAGLSQQFTFDFTMPGKVLRVEIQTGRIIDIEEIIDDRYPKTIQYIPQTELNIISVGVMSD